MLKALELKIPPLIQFFFCTVLIFMTSRHSLNFKGTSLVGCFIAITIGGLGLFIAILGVWFIKKAKTTVDPRFPDRVSTIVSGGIYSYSRNPMYLGMLLGLISFSILSGNYFSFLWCFLFYFYMNQFQIKPEERFLEEKFGQEYIDYLSHVRRWL